jgi:hypothetical protein
MRLGVVRGSSFIKAVGFSGSPGEVGILRIRFDDATLDFENVPYRTYRGLVVAKEHTQFYLKNIHGQFDYKKI